MEPFHPHLLPASRKLLAALLVDIIELRSVLFCFAIRQVVRNSFALSNFNTRHFEPSNQAKGRMPNKKNRLVQEENECVLLRQQALSTIKFLTPCASSHFWHSHVGCEPKYPPWSFLQGRCYSSHSLATKPLYPLRQEETPPAS